MENEVKKKFEFNKPDLHMHSVFSDGSDDPRKLIDSVKKAGIDLFALTDHDSYEGCAEVESLLCDSDPKFICGVELSCEDEQGKYHILGYSYNVNKPSIRDAIELTHSARVRKAGHRVKFLRETCGFDITEEEERELLSNPNPGKPHFVQFLLKKGYVSSKTEGFELVDKYKEKERKLTPDEAIEAILQADGIPVLAHGILGSGSQILTKEEIDQRVARLKAMGLMGLECYYSTYTDWQRDVMISLAEKYNLLITAGSDYHGINKTIPVGGTGDVEKEKMKRFYRAVERLLLERE